MVLGWRLFKQRRKHRALKPRRYCRLYAALLYAFTDANAHERTEEESINQSINPRVPTRQSIGRLTRSCALTRDDDDDTEDDDAEDDDENDDANDVAATSTTTEVCGRRRTRDPVEAVATKPS